MKWRMEYTEVNGEKYPVRLWRGTQNVIQADAIEDNDGSEVRFLDMHDHEVAEVLEKLNRAEGEE